MKTMYFDHASRGELEYRERKMPVARGHNIVVKIHASSMNPHDWKYHQALQSIYKLPSPMPGLTLGHDLSGTVVEVGKKVNRFKVGDEVYAMSAKTGAFGEYLSLDSRMVAFKPKNTSHVEAASIPMAALTAWQAFILSDLKEDDNVLVIGGSGGVGVHAIQIAKARGAVVTTVCSTANIELVKSLGADYVIDYTKEDVLQSEKVFDVVFDTIGTMDPYKVKAILNPHGRFVSTLPDSRLFSSILASRIPGVPINKTSTLLAMPVGRHLEKIGKLVETGELRPVIDKEFDIEDIEAAIDYSKTGRTRGKIALRVR